MSNQVWQLSDEAYADLCLRASKYEDLKAELEQIRAEIASAMDMEPAWKGQDNYVGGLEIALSIIDKAIKEQNDGYK